MTASLNTVARENLSVFTISRCFVMMMWAIPLRTAHWKSAGVSTNANFCAFETPCALVWSTRLKQHSSIHTSCSRTLALGRISSFICTRKYIAYTGDSTGTQTALVQCFTEMFGTSSSEHVRSSRNSSSSPSRELDPVVLLPGLLHSCHQFHVRMSSKYPDCKAASLSVASGLSQCGEQQANHCKQAHSYPYQRSTVGTKRYFCGFRWTASALKRQNVSSTSSLCVQWLLSPSAPS